VTPAFAVTSTPDELDGLTSAMVRAAQRDARDRLKRSE
jgi:hypothetical protein